MVSRIIILSAAVFLVAQAFSIDPFKIDKVQPMKVLFTTWQLCVFFLSKIAYSANKFNQKSSSAMGEIQKILQQDLPIRLGGS